MKKVIFIFLLTLLLGGCGETPNTKKAEYKAFCASGMEFLAVGEEGVMAEISMQGEITPLNTVVNKDLYDIEYIDGNVLAVGEKGTIILQDASGKMKRVDSGYSENLYSSTYFQNRYFVGGENGVLISEDGKTWTQELRGKSIKSIAASQDVCIAISEKGKLWYTQDGQTWTELDYNEYYGKDITFQEIIFGGESFYLTGNEDGKIVLLTSTGGTVWSERPMDMVEGEMQDLTSKEFTNVVWNGNEAVAGCKNGEILILPGCVECNKLEKTEMKTLSQIGYCGGYFLLQDEEGNIKVQESESSRQYKVSPKTAFEESEKGTILVDVRTDEEYNEKHIKGSVHIPLNKIEELATYYPQKGTKIIFYCTKGTRSQTAVEKALEMGYSNVFCMGKLEEWPGEWE